MDRLGLSQRFAHNTLVSDLQVKGQKPKHEKNFRSCKALSYKRVVKICFMVIVIFYI